mgnify:CR=1 FL=1
MLNELSNECGCHKMLSSGANPEDTRRGELQMQCEFCNHLFSVKRRGPRNVRFCSPACQHKGWCAKHKKRVLELWRNYSRKHRVKRLQYVKEYFKTNPEVNKRAVKKYSLTERGKIVNRKKIKAYRARKLGATGSHTLEEFLTLVLLFDNFCPACGNRFATEDFTEDHIVPLSCGGNDNISNIQPLCRPCNSRKRNKTIIYQPIIQKGE